MKNANQVKKVVSVILGIALLASCYTKIKSTTADAPVDITKKHLYLDVHNLDGPVTLETVAVAHQKDLAAQGPFGVKFLKYWVDEAKGKVYCLAESGDSASICQAHKAAHGLVPDLVHQVVEGMETAMRSNPSLFFDVHNLGAGKVTAGDVAHAHEKDLAAQDKFDVSFINYWLDEKSGVVMCLADAPDSAAMVNTHKAAHGLIPDEVHKIKEGR